MLPGEFHDDPAANARTWYVLHVKPRTEKKVETFLVRYGCFHYLPLYEKVRRVQRRKVRTTLPLFPGYVFTRLNSAERLKMLQTKLLVRPIAVPCPREMIHQLRQIAHLLRTGADRVKPVNPFKTGDLVRIVSGPFRGLEGRVKRTGADATIVLNLDVLGQAVETAISPADCAAAD